MALKACFIDVTHWHAPPYYMTLQRLVGVAALTARTPQTGRRWQRAWGPGFMTTGGKWFERRVLTSSLLWADTATWLKLPDFYWRKAYRSRWKNPWA